MTDKPDNEPALKQIILAFVRSKDFLVNTEMSPEVVDFLSTAYNCEAGYIRDKFIEINTQYYSDQSLSFKELTVVDPDEKDSE